MADLAFGAIKTAQGLLKIADMFDEISHAKIDIHYFHLETTNFIQVLEIFSITVEESIGHLEQDQQGQRRAVVNSTIELFDNARRDIESVANRIVLNINNVDSPLQKFAIHIRWYMKRNFITGLRFKLERVKSSANLCISTTICEDLKRRIRELESAQQEVPRHLMIKMQHYSERVRSEKVVARKAAKKMISFQMSHKGVDVLSRDDTQLFQGVERAIQRQASTVVPKRRRPQTKNSSSGHKGKPLTGETTDDPNGIRFTPRREPTRRHPKKGGVRPHSREQERTPKPSRSRYRRSSTSPPPPSTSSRNTRAETHPVACHFSTRNEQNASGKIVNGCRVRDDGQSVRVERGIWPGRVLNSSQQSLDDGTHTTVNRTTETNKETRSEFVAPEQQGHIPERQNYIPDAFPCEDGEDNIGLEARGDHADSDGNKWQPVPPFNNEDRKERGST